MDATLTVEQLQTQVKALEHANKLLQIRALEAELGGFDALMAMIQVKGPIAQNQLKMLRSSLPAQQPVTDLPQVEAPKGE
jgi:hypothetical protein